MAKGKLITISVDSITQDKVCMIRRINPAYVKDLAAIVTQAITPYGDNKGADPIEVFNGHPFPPIIVRALEREVIGKDKAEAVKYGPQRYGVVAGYHRWRTMGDVKLKDAVVELREYKSDAEALSDAIADNLANGLHLTKDDRDAAILRLHKDGKVSVRELAKRFTMGIASISRICSGKQRKKGPRKKAAKKGSTRPAVVASTTKASGFAPVQYLKEIRAMSDLYVRNADAITVAAKDTRPFLSSSFVEFVQGLGKAE